jgi:hypothetical protein
VFRVFLPGAALAVGQAGEAGRLGQFDHRRAAGQGFQRLLLVGPL